MQKNTKIFENVKIFTSCLFACAAAVLLMSFCQPASVTDENNDYSESVNNLSESDKMAVEGQLKSFRQNGKLEFFEYTNEVSNIDTAIYYYFSGVNENSKSAFAEINRYLSGADVSVDVDEITDLIYYYSLICEKYDVNASSALTDAIVKCEKYYDGCSFSDETEVYDFYQIYEAAKITGTEMNSSVFENAVSEVTVENNGYLMWCIKNVCTQDKEVMRETLDIIVNAYQEKNIDISTFILCAGIMPEEYIASVPRSFQYDIADFCEENYYTSSRITGFTACRILDICGFKDYSIRSSIISGPINNDGMVPLAVNVDADYRTIFEYTEICNVLDIYVNEKEIYRTVADIDSSELSEEDIYYQTQLAEKYPNIQVNKVNSLENSDTIISESFELFFIFGQK